MRARGAVATSRTNPARCHCWRLRVRREAPSHAVGALRALALVRVLPRFTADTACRFYRQRRSEASSTVLASSGGVLGSKSTGKAARTVGAVHLCIKSRRADLARRGAVSEMSRAALSAATQARRCIVRLKACRAGFCTVAGAGRRELPHPKARRERVSERVP
jgi:hypothetical protein